MIIVKLFVSFVSINVLCFCLADYCAICTNHTLCKYNIPGPSAGCQSYDSAALITSQDITQLLNKINERRNFVAMGHSRILPQAANMKKIHWSPELATFAQRWVDQCDPVIRPDREDQCRNLETSMVGQNIASVTGPAPGLNVKSFVETWFIQVLEYTGSVIYYNQSRDVKTKYFTQLIWADTESVGCGKAKFYVDDRDMMLERLVCNFAPKGNIHGKPVYVIGYAASQCPNDMSPDEQFKGLCVYEDYGNLRKLQTQRPPVSSLLRILNLSNNSVKQEIDPIRSNLKQIHFNSSIRNEHRNQKTRHVSLNNTYSAMKRISPLRKQNFWKSLMNTSRNEDEYISQQERGHSHVYHGHETPRNNYGPFKEEYTLQGFRRYDYGTQAIDSYSSKNHRKYDNQYHQCTRKMGVIQNDCTKNDCTSETNCADSHCTRGITQGCQQGTTIQPTFREISFTYPIEDHIVPHDMCPCTKQTCRTTPASCNCNINCRCLNAPCPTNTNCFTTPCPKIHRMGDEDFKDDTRKSGTFQYYDMLNIAVRSGDKKSNEETSPENEVIWHAKSGIKNSFKDILQNKGSEQIKTQVKDVIDRSRYEDQDRDYLYHSFDSSIRKRRQIEDQGNPLWHMDDYNYKGIPQLKSLRYTTLGNKRNRKSRKHMGSVNLLISTEPITIQLTDTSNDNDDSRPHVTEKYLSFEELMHLRKFSDGYGDYDYRRKGTKKKTTKAGATTKKATTTAKSTTKVTPKAVASTKATTKASQTTKAATSTSTTKATATTSAAKLETSEITTNTPFERKKHCTRKLTCTWTAFTATASDGSVIGPGGGELDMGSRTPPGYVDGCTRTSTCTRDYMNRNKMATLPDDNVGIGDNGGDNGGTPDDEDYCERRSLNVQRRNLDSKNENSVFTIQQEDNTDTTVPVDYSTEFVSYIDKDTRTESVSETSDYSCNEEHNRRKRQENSRRQFLRERNCDDTKKEFSYSDLYYLVLNKIIKAQKNSQSHQNEGCQCNSTAKIENTCIIIQFLIIFNISHVFRFMRCFIKLLYQ